MKLGGYKLCVKVALLLVLSLPLLGLPGSGDLAGGCGNTEDDEVSREKAAVRTPETSGGKAAVRTAKDVPPSIDHRPPQGLAQASPTGTTVPVSRPSSKLSVVPTSTTTPLRRITPFPRAKSVPTLTPTPTVSAARRPIQQPPGTYVHPLGLWRINYPADWELTSPTWDADRSIESVVFTKPIPRSFFFARLRVIRHVGYEYADSREFSRTVLGILEDISAAYELISWKKISFEGIPAYEVVYFTKQEQQEVGFARIDLHLVVGEDAYRVLGVTDQDAWDEAKGLLKELVYSFRPLH